jgi:hypothetical protein
MTNSAVITHRWITRALETKERLHAFAQRSLAQMNFVTTELRIGIRVQN